MTTQAQESAVGSLSSIEGVTIKLESAPFLRRVAAYIVDMAIVGACVYALIVIVFAFGMAAFVGASAVSKDAGIISGIVIVVLAVLALLAFYDSYFIYFEHKYGATYGKRLMGLRVVTLEGNRPSLGQCVAREVLRYIDCTLLFPGPIAILFSSKRQRIGDMVAHTRVVYSQRAEAAQHALYIDHDAFLLHSSESPSKEMSRAFAIEFMTYASKRFLLGDLEGTAAISEAEWINRFERETGQKRPSGVSDKECLRFFAECCVRRMAASDKPYTV